MAGDRVGRIYKGPRRPQTVRVPVEHYAHYTQQARLLNVPIADYIVYRIAVVEDLDIPDAVLLAHPGLLDLLPDDRRANALKRQPGLAAKYEAHYTEQARHLKVPIADYLVYRIAAVKGLDIPDAVLLALPGLLDLLPDDRRANALKRQPGLAAKYEALFDATTESQQMELHVA